MIMMGMENVNWREVIMTRSGGLKTRTGVDMRKSCSTAAAVERTWFIRPLVFRVFMYGI